MVLGGLVACKLSSWAATHLAAVKPNHAPACVGKSIGNRSRDAIIPLYLAFVGTHVED